MKKSTVTKFLVALAVLAFTVSAGRRASAAGDSKIFEIREKMFIEQCNDIYLNPDDYAGRRIKLEGIYEENVDEESGEIFRYVFRYGPGCCGNDGVAGFECVVEPGALPKRGDWVEAIGTVEVGQDADGLDYVVLKPSRLTVMEKRGAEYVNN
ncbi:MAG: hypothetical protein LBQ90_12035 [Synergistaceae bacterium]|jgi:uncharacterized membrane protein YcgQ (UPF0703/DUF1980 family)|nr:hypothetical protein [Synergistaceae bacterium]